MTVRVGRLLRALKALGSNFYLKKKKSMWLIHQEIKLIKNLSVLNCMVFIWEREKQNSAWQFEIAFFTRYAI